MGKPLILDKVENRPVVDVQGHRMALHDPAIDRYISPSLATSGVFEPWETELVRAEIRPGDVVLDVGANIGYYSLLFARWVGPHGRVYAFEPDPANFALLQHNVALNGYRNVVLVNKAVSDHSGAGRLFHSDINTGDHRVYDSLDGKPSVPIKTVDLDSFFARSPERFAFIKFDIQGAEATALHGMRELVHRHPRLKMIVEFWPFGLRKCGTEATPFLDLLETMGFRLFDVDEARVRLVPVHRAELLAAHTAESETFTNLLCVKVTETPTATINGGWSGWLQRLRFGRRKTP